MKSNNTTIKIGIIGGAGYTAGELLRILLHHPNTELVFVHSESQSGRPIDSIHTDLVGDIFMTFTNEISLEINLLFLCMGHGRSNDFLLKNEIPDSIKIIDLSTEFRLKSNAQNFVYGLPELNKKTIRNAQNIANPGCFATAIQLALLPLAAANLLQKEVHIHAITGSTGAGQNPSKTTHFSWRNNNLSIYKPFSHQHLEEIHQSVQQLQTSFDKTIHFLPLRGDFARGIFASIYMEISAKEDYLIQLYEAFYQDAPFTHITKQNLDLKQVIHTNKCLLKVQKIDGKILITSIIDNLSKGASGQAVQNMNLQFGLPETAGLNLKAGVF
ncbi:MAG: N-acetyl-gamma-glutamyl-phosphate reductase [Paraglaciecola sp.]|jgi:N-acetyl-gamma-glutamyl-phosphate reductase